MKSTREMAASMRTDVHFLHDKAHSRNFDGLSALCDFKNANLEDSAPRQYTFSSSTESEVTCEDCLIWLEQGYRK